MFFIKICFSKIPYPIRIRSLSVPDLLCFRFTRIYFPHVPLKNLKERKKYENFFPVNGSVRTRKNPANTARENPASQYVSTQRAFHDRIVNRSRAPAVSGRTMEQEALG